jgi:hypothetical protein
LRLVIVILVGTVLATSACSVGSDAAERAPTDSEAAATVPDVRLSVARSQFARGYAVGWRSGCEHAFRRLLAAATHDARIDFSVEDCYELAPSDVTATLPSATPPGPHAAGVRMGTRDGCRAAGDVMRKLLADWSANPSLVDATCR